MMKKFYNTDDVERFAMANCAMILNRAESRLSGPGRVFKCRTCHRGFETFQALGGHTASHKRPKLGAEKQLVIKAHKCSVCKQEFWTGQALGGHMRSHRTPKISFFGSNEISHNNNNNNNNNSSTITTRDDRSDDFKMIDSNCDGTRILGLDLNLSPEANELKIFEF